MFSFSSNPIETSSRTLHQSKSIAYIPPGSLKPKMDLVHIADIVTAISLTDAGDWREAHTRGPNNQGPTKTTLERKFSRRL